MHQLDSKGVESTPVGVGRRVDILKAVSQSVDFPLVVATGVHREPRIPAWVYNRDEGDLREWMQAELEEGIEDTGVKAGWIKLSAGDDDLTMTEAKVLRAAARAAANTGAAIGSHTIRGRVVDDQLTILEDCGFSTDRFIWIHAQIDPDFEMNLEMAWHGAWIEYDAIGDPVYTEVIVDRVLRMLDAGLGDQVLLSQDRGWFDPAQPGGGLPRPFTYLAESFLPRLRQEGVDEQTIRLLTHDNPFRAFSRRI
jgi:phosphotriesterase-related protein